MILTDKLPAKKLIPQQIRAKCFCWFLFSALGRLYGHVLRFVVGATQMVVMTYMSCMKLVSTVSIWFLKLCVFFYYSEFISFEPLDIHIYILYLQMLNRCTMYSMCIYIYRYVYIRLACLTVACVPLLAHHRLGVYIMHTYIYMLYTIYILCMMTNFSLCNYNYI